MQHLHREIESLKKELIREAGLVETNLHDSIKALMERDHDLAKEIIARDKDIDELEVEVEEECLKIFALYQPVAIDLRYIVAFLKLNNDLERIGDLASNIAVMAASLALKPQVEIPEQIPKMTVLVQKMLKDSLDSLVDMDGEKARSVLLQDDEVDDLHHSMYATVGNAIKSDPDNVEMWMEIQAVSRYLERIADHCTNIAEDVEYMVHGNIQRHQGLTD